MYGKYAAIGELAHLVERLVRNQKVVGSSPIFSTSFVFTSFLEAAGGRYFSRWSLFSFFNAKKACELVNNRLFCTDEIKNSDIRMNAVVNLHRHLSFESL